MANIPVNNKRISRMMGRRIDQIAPEDLRDSNFEEYHLSKIWAAKSLVTMFLTDWARPLYRWEYSSFKQQQRFSRLELKPEYANREDSPDLDRYKAEDTLKAK